MMKLGEYLSLVLLLAACSKPDVSPRIDINFAAVGEQLAESKAGSDMIQTAELTQFGLYASIAENDEEFASTLLFSGNAVEPVVKQADNSWRYTNLKYWEYGKHYHFRAYHPYNGNFTVNYAASNSDDISIDYRMGVPNQSDLLFAYAAVEANETTINQKVMMNFKHALAALRFRIKLRDGMEGSDDITSFYMKGFHPTGVVHYGYDENDRHTPTIKWTIPDYFETSDEFFRWDGEKEFSASSMAEVFDNDGVVFVIPQTVYAGKTKVYFTVKSTDDTLYELTLPEDTWNVGKYYIYTITLLGPSADLHISIKDWDIIETSHSIYL